MKKKGFYFKDYDESEIFSYNKNSNTIKISLNRITFLSFIFFSLILIFSIKIIYLSLSPEKSFYSNNIKRDLITIKDLGVKCGLAIKPGTDERVLDDYMDIDLNQYKRDLIDKK